MGNLPYDPRDPYGPNRRLTERAGDGGSAFRFIAVLIVIDIVWLTARGASYGLFAAGSEAEVGATRTGFLVDLLSFTVLIVLVALAMKHVYRRHWIELLGNLSRLVPDFLRVFAACLAVYLVLIFMGWDASLTQMRPLGGWLAFLPIALLGILIQTGAEEVLYRGFVHQYCVALFRRPLYWFAIPAIAFGLSHAYADPSSTASMVAYVVWTTAFAVAAIDLTARTGSLGAAWGLHMAVNVTAMTIGAQDGAPMSAAALFTFPERAPDYVTPDNFVYLGMVFELIFLGVLWLAARNAIRR